MNTNEPFPIICGTDFSENATVAVHAAAALAQRFNAPLILAHSVDERAEFPNHLRPRLMNDDRLRLAEEAERLRKLGLTFEEKLLRGAPDDGIASFAGKAQARLLVVAASGTGALGRWVLGDVAERIAETSPVPTLVVRAAEPFLAWAGGKRALKVFVATDFTATADAALRWVAELRQTGPCEITFGYIDRPQHERGELAILEAMRLMDERPEARQALERDLREKAARLLGTEPVIRIEPGSARVDAHLIQLATEAGADLLVVGTHQWRGFDRLRHTSISRLILRDAPMSVACVPVAVEAMEVIPALHRVLVATDFSDNGGRAIPHAYSVLPGEGAVCLLHVAKLGEPKPKEELEAHLRALIPAQAAARGVASEVRVVESNDPAGAIRDAADRFGADLVCIGSHGRTGLTATLLGSVAQAVIAQSPRPVLVVRPPAA